MGPRGPLGWMALLGFAMGGFFDGVLLHQVLRWHHLLSLVKGVDDLATQLAWDGYFHVLMYLVAVVALVGLFRRRGDLDDLSGRALLVAALAGFAFWQVVDVVGFHWIAGIHRIRVDTPNPLAWDLGWLAVVGGVPALAAAWLSRAPTRGRGGLAALALAGLAVGGGLWAGRPPPGPKFTTVVFARSVSPDEAIGALAGLDARIVDADRNLRVMVLSIPASQRWRLYARGALLVSGAGVAGCLDWARAGAARV
jgi:uncharacterized membrane protein